MAAGMPNVNTVLSNAWLCGRLRSN